MSERAKRCGNCGAWRAWRMKPDEDKQSGSCRRHAPSMAGAVLRSAFHDDDNYYRPVTAMWPATLENQWCLDWLPREADEGDKP